MNAIITSLEKGSEETLTIQVYVMTLKKNLILFGCMKSLIVYMKQASRMISFLYYSWRTIMYKLQ